jgi:hypothetical protein
VHNVSPGRAVVITIKKRDARGIALLNFEKNARWMCFVLAKFEETVNILETRAFRRSLREWRLL